MQRFGHCSYSMLARCRRRPSTIFANGFYLSPKPRSLTISARNASDTPGLPHMLVPHSGFAHDPGHVDDVSDHLARHGILKLSLRFPDEKSQYLGDLIVSLHQQCGHGPPISHSASRGWFWDVRPQPGTVVHDHRARSETMENFPWHTDCSYEECPPRYFALHVLQPDRCGGGTLSVMKVDQLWGMLSAPSREALCRKDYRIQIPAEFVKQLDQRHIVDRLLTVDRGRGGQSTLIRFREDIVTPLNEGAESALSELKALLRQCEASSACLLHLTPAHLPRNSIVLMDNRRWLHSRNAVRDPARHLRRVRWDAIPFSNV